MPPKQKQVKKGPSYKPATPMKDMVPSTIKEQPRDPRPLKVPQSTIENQDKNNQGANQNPILFEQWPSQQTIKAHDFGIGSEAKFQDKFHDSIAEYVKKQNQSSDQMMSWKHLHELESLKQKEIQPEEEYQEEEGNQNPKSSIDLQQKQKHISENNIAEKNKPMVVIETYLRQQTEEQMEKRKKQEAQKALLAAKDKKKGKKQQPKEEGPLQVSDVRMSNILVNRNMCKSGIWIGSQLQIVKTRDLKDIYNEQPIWKKIYPQENGVPQITKSGKYWVKLYYMGKAVKVEVDDRVPVGNNIQELFPKSQTKNQKWTLILTKALIKLIAISNPKAQIIGSGLIINALTGMITQNVKIRNMEAWVKVKNMMNDIRYTKKDILVNCFSFKGIKQPPSNSIANKQQMKDILTLQNSTFKKKLNRRSSATQLMGIKSLDDQIDLADQKIQQRQVESNILGGYSYCIGDYFENNQFNMVFSKDKSFRQQKLKIEYNQMSKVALGNKSRQEKLEHRRKKKQIKEKLLLEQKKRLDLIKMPLKKYRFLKILSNLVIRCQYSHKEILLAKRCLLNNLEKPLNYDVPNLEKEKEKQKQKEQSKLGSTTNLKYKEDAEINPPIDDFSSVQNYQEILERKQEGIWVNSEDLLNVFDQFQFFFNPNTFEFKSIEQVNNKVPREFTTDENKEILVLYKKGNPHLQPQNEQENKKQNITLIFGFAFQESKWDTLCDPYCMIQKFDFESYRTASNIATLNAPLSSTHLTLNNNNSVFRIYTISKGRYSYWISSDSKYKLLSISDYLIEFEAYTQKSFTIEYPSIEKKTYLTLSRLKIKHQGQEKNTVYIKIKNCPKEIESYLSIKAIQIPEQGPYTVQRQEGIIEKIQENSHLAYQYTRLQLKPNKAYSIIIEAYPNQNLSQGTIQLQMLSKESSAFIDQTQQIEPYKIVQKYSPNKYATILKERLFCNNNINATVMVKIFEGQEGQPVVTDKKASKKGGKDETTFEVVQRQMKVKRLIHVKLFKNGSVIYYNKDYNEVIIPNVQFEKTKQNVTYYLEASFDLREWSEAGIISDDTNKIYWSAQVTGEDSIAFVKDTLQEEKQKQTRKSWEDKQPGRADKAKRARQKFLLELKKERGQALTEQEQQIVNAPRLTRKKLLEEEKKNEDKKGGKAAKKDDKKGAKDKKQQVVEEKQQEKPVPKSQDNFMKEVKEFLYNLQECKVKKIELQEGEEYRIRSEQEQRSIKEGALMAKENRAAQIVRNIELRETMKIKEKQKKDKLTILLEDSRNNFNSEWKKYLQWRTQDIQKDKVRQQKQKALIDLVNQEKPTISQADLTKLIGQYRNIEGSNKKLADVVDMIRKNIRINNLIDKINVSLEGWEVDTLKNILQEIKNDKVEGLNPEVLSKVSSMLEEAAKNPGIVAQKQTQLKKGKKPGKK